MSKFLRMMNLTFQAVLGSFPYKFRIVTKFLFIAPMCSTLRCKITSPLNHYLYLKENISVAITWAMLQYKNYRVMDGAGFSPGERILFGDFWLHIWKLNTASFFIIIKFCNQFFVTLKKYNVSPDMRYFFVVTLSG